MNFKTRLTISLYCEELQRMKEIKIDFKLVSKGLGLSLENTKKFIKDGRITGKLCEFYIAEKEKMVHEDKKDYDVSKNNSLFEVRHISGRGVRLQPSNQIGQGRKFNEELMLKKFDKIEGFIFTIYDHDVLYYQNVSSKNIKKLYEDGKISKSISHKKAKNLFFPEFQQTTKGCS